MQHLDVVGAVIVDGERVLCVRRGPSRHLSGMWEFPGGKIDPGESAQSALVREIREELGCDIEVSTEVASTTHDYAFGSVTLTTFYCTLVSGYPELSEHVAMVWLPARELRSLDWAPADLPAVEVVVEDLT